MAVMIDIPGIGEVKAENAASEATLREILRALGGRSGQVGGAGGGGAGGGAAVGDASKKAAKNVTGLGNASNVATDSIGKMASAAGSIVGGVFNQLIAAGGAVVGAVTGFGTSLLKGANSIADLTANVPGLNLITGAVEGQVQLYKDLSSVGAGFSNDMFELTRVAGTAALSQQTFSKIVAENSEGLRLFGATVQGGSRRFATLSKELRTGQMGQQLLSMGLTTEELNENLISYNEFLTTTGRQRLMTDKQLADQSAKYSLELDKVARLTGKSRKDLEAEMRQKNSDIRRQVAMANMTSDQQIAFAANLEVAGAKSKEFEAALLDMADGIANDPVTQQLMANSPTFQKFATEIENMSPAELNNFMKQVGDEMKALAIKFKDGGVDAAMNTQFGQILQIGGQLATTIETSDTALDNEQNARNTFTEKVTNSVTTMEALSAATQNLVINTDAFNKSLEIMGNMIPSYETAMDAFDQAAPHVTKAIDDAFTWVSTTGKELMQKAISYFKTDMLPKIMEFVEKLGPIIEDMVAFGAKFLADPAGTFKDIIIPAIKDFAVTTFAALAGAVGLYFGGKAILGLLATGLGALFVGPLAIPAMIVAGIAGVFGTLFAVDKLLLDGAIGDGIAKAWKSATSFISDAFTGIIDWFKGLFDFDFGGFFKDMIPDWVPFFGDDDDDTAPAGPKGDDGGSFTDKIKNWWNDDDEEQSSPKDSSKKQNVDKKTSYKGSNTEGNNDLAMLNTNMRELIELQKKNNRLVGANSGNLMTG